MVESADTRELHVEAAAAIFGSRVLVRHIRRATDHPLADCAASAESEQVGEYQETLEGTVRGEPSALGDREQGRR